MSKKSTIDRLVKRSSSIEIQILDNGFVFVASGRDELNEWVSSKIYVHDATELIDYIRQYSSLGED